ncbi:hypothetical protein [Butyrivibrio sp. MC2013]|uniref:hypothetical protein n=1 Tax=Butyrivibrio sp. MC2013 TaxID=1280686 RepID=UPI0004239BA9|nr:hypothetical protein [Butyrivibrio sp. MC2013]
MYKYLFYGLHLECDEAIFQLLPDDSDAPADIRFIKGGIPGWLRDKKDKPHYDFGPNESWLMNSTGWIYAINGDTVYYDDRLDADTGYDMLSYMTGYGISMVLMQRGMLPVHCSAVYGDEGAVIISGASGAGKSTVTSLFLDRGYELMADDIAAISVNEDNTVTLYPAFPYQKYCRDQADRRGLIDENAIYIDEEKDKFLVPVSNFRKEPAKVSRMIILSKADVTEVKCAELTGLSKLFAFSSNLFLSRLRGDWQKEPALMNECLKAASGFPISAIIRPSEGNSLPDIEKLIFNS